MLQILCKAGRCDDSCDDGKTLHGASRRDAIAKTSLPIFSSTEQAGQLRPVQGSRGTRAVPQPQRTAYTANHTASAKPRSQETVAASSTSVHSHPPRAGGLHILSESLISLSIISKKRKSLSALAALPVPRIVLLHHHNSRPTAGRELCPPPLPKHGSAPSPLPQPSSQLEELSRGSSLAQCAFPPSSRTS